MKYKSKDGSDFFIPNIGKSTDGVIETTVPIENPSLELISEAPVQSTIPTAAPGAVIGVAPQATAPQPVVATVPTPVQVVQTQPNNQEQN